MVIKQCTHKSKEDRTIDRTICIPEIYPGDSNVSSDDWSSITLCDFLSFGSATAQQLRYSRM